MDELDEETMMFLLEAAMGQQKITPLDRLQKRLEEACNHYVGEIADNNMVERMRHAILTEFPDFLVSECHFDERTATLSFGIVQLWTFLFQRQSSDSVSTGVLIPACPAV